MAAILAHVLAAYVVLAAPWLGRYWYEKARRRSQSAEPNAKIRLYRWQVMEQVLFSAAILVFWRLGQIPATSLGLNLPRFGLWTTAALLAIVATLVWSGLKLRPKADKIREKLRNGIGLLLPDTASERSWFAGVSVGAGISEELGYRAFLLYYLSTYLPQLNTPERVVLWGWYSGWGTSIRDGRE